MYLNALWKLDRKGEDDDEEEEGDYVCRPPGTRVVM